MSPQADTPDREDTGAFGLKSLYGCNAMSQDCLPETAICRKKPDCWASR